MDRNVHEKRSSPCAGLPVSITCGFRTLEQRIIWEAVVLPDITKVLAKYAELLETNGHE